jgi:hypothetical protein
MNFSETHRAARFVLAEQRKLPGSERSVLVARGSTSWTLSWDTLARTGARRHSAIPRRVGETHSSSTARIRGVTMRHDFTWIPFRMSVMEGGVVAGPVDFICADACRLVQQDRRNDANISCNLQNLCALRLLYGTCI